MRKTFSIVLKFLIGLSSFSGVIASLFFYKYDNYSYWSKRLLYFTAQSNIWIGLTCLVIIFYQIFNKSTKNIKLKKFLYLLKYIFTVSIILTGLIFCFILAPKAPLGYHPWSFFNILTHIVTPILATIDFFIDDNQIKLKKHYIYLSIIPPLFYMFFSTLLSLIKIDFGHGENFPYFFLNFWSPVGFFGFSNQPPYIMGSFYWINIFLLVVLLISFLLSKIQSTLLNTKKRNNNIEKS